jgi:hypothetical protein
VTSSASDASRIRRGNGGRSGGHPASGVTGCCGQSLNRPGVPSRFLLRGLARENTHSPRRKGIKR